MYPVQEVKLTNMKAIWSVEKRRKPGKPEKTKKPRKLEKPRKPAIGLDGSLTNKL